MTAVIATKKIIDGRPEIVLACDSLSVRGDTAVQHETDRRKFIKFPHFTVAYSGIASTHLVLTHMASRRTVLNKPYMKMVDVEDARQFAAEVYEELKNRIGENLEAVGNLVIATQERIFLADTYSFVVETDRYATTGCGEPFLQASMEALYETINTKQDLEEVTRKCVAIACKLNVFCGEPIMLVNITNEETKPQRSKTKKPSSVARGRSSSNAPKARSRSVKAGPKHLRV